MTSANNRVQATPDCALSFILAPESGAPDAEPSSAIRTTIMKRTILSVSILVVACVICSLVTYRLAYDAGFARAKQLQKGTFVGTMEALGKHRAGDVAAATDRIESLCFSSAISLYDNPAYRDEFVTKTFASELIQYRATNRTEWTPVEKKLETILVSWK
jgi:hypothetical protein